MRRLAWLLCFTINCSLLTINSLQPLHAQKSVSLTLDEVIRLAHQRSLSATVARLNFMSSYWSWRSYKAQFLPSINLSSNLMQYDHSTVQARSSDDGRIYMVDNNSLANSVTLSIDQNIAALGGTLSVQSYLYRLDQFDYDTKTFNSQPLRLQYTQPLFAYNSLKWDKKTEPLRYDEAKRTYLESMEGVTESVVTLFFNVLVAQNDLKQSRANLTDRERLLEMSQKRLKLGTTTKSDVLQLELSVINTRMEVREQELTLNSARFALASYLMMVGEEDTMELLAPTDVPALTLNETQVIQRAMENSSFLSSQKLELLEDEETLAETKAARRAQMELTAEVGFSRTADHFRDAYRNLENSQIVGLSFSVPIFDWGVGKGKVRMAEADLEATRTSQQKEYDEYVQEIRTDVMHFNMQYDQCQASQRAQEIAGERYEITRRRFEEGNVSVTDLNTAWQECESARSSYISQLQTYWSSYYALRKTTLFDWQTNRDLSADFDSLIKK